MKSFIVKTNLPAGKTELVRQRDKRRGYFNQSSLIREKPQSTISEEIQKQEALNAEIDEISKKSQELRNIEQTEADKLIDKHQRAHVAYASTALKELFYTKKEREIIKKSEERQAKIQADLEWTKKREDLNKLAEKKKYMRLTVLNEDGTQTIYESNTYTKYKGIKVDWGLGGFSNTKKLQNIFFQDFHDNYEKKHKKYFEGELRKNADKRHAAEAVFNKSYKKRVPSFPKSLPPVSLHLPFYKKPQDKYVSAFSKINQKYGSYRFKINFGSPKVPGWLVEISVHAYKILRAIKDVLYNIEDIHQDINRPVKLIHYLINHKLKLPISQFVICKILHCIPFDENKGPSFKHFLFGLANPSLAMKKGYFLHDPEKICCKGFNHEGYNPKHEEYKFHPVLLGYDKGWLENEIPPKPTKKEEIEEWEDEYAHAPKKIETYIPIYSIPSDPIVVLTSNAVPATQKNITSKPDINKKKSKNDNKSNGYDADSENDDADVKFTMKPYSLQKLDEEKKDEKSCAGANSSGGGGGGGDLTHNHIRINNTATPNTSKVVPSKPVTETGAVVIPTTTTATIDIQDKKNETEQDDIEIQPAKSGDALEEPLELQPKPSQLIHEKTNQHGHGHNKKGPKVPAAPQYNVIKYETWVEIEEKKAKLLEFFTKMGVSPEHFSALEYDMQVKLAKAHVTSLLELLGKQAFQIKRQDEKDKLRAKVGNTERLDSNDKKCSLRSNFFVKHYRKKKKLPYELFQFANTPILDEDPAYKIAKLKKAGDGLKIQTINKDHKVIESKQHQRLLGGPSGRTFQPPKRRPKPVHAEKPAVITEKASAFENVTRARRKIKAQICEAAKAKIRTVESILPPNLEPIKEKKACLRLREEYDMYKKKFYNASLEERNMYWMFERRNKFAKPLSRDPTPPLSPEYQYPEETEWYKREKRRKIEFRRERREEYKEFMLKQQELEKDGEREPIMAEQEQSSKAGAGGAAGADVKPYPKSTGNTGYSLVEQIFYSGLLLFYMYDLTKELEKVYNQSHINYPIPNKKKAKELDIQNSVGIVKKDAKKPEVSPYLTSFPICHHRLFVQKPNKHEVIRGCCSKTQIKTVHMLATLSNLTKDGEPKKKHAEIKVQENRHRIKQALRALAVNNPVASLPDLDCLIHFTDPIVHISQTVVRNPEPTNPPDMKPVLHGQEMSWINNSWKDLYQPIGLPPKAKGQFGSFTEYSDQIELQKLVKADQNHGWKAFADKRKRCVDELYDRMNILSLPEGRTRDMFNKTYNTLLPKEPVMNFYIGRNTGSFL